MPVFETGTFNHSVTSPEGRDFSIVGLHPLFPLLKPGRFRR